MKAAYVKLFQVPAELLSLRCPLALCPYSTLKDVTKYTPMKYSVVNTIGILLRMLFITFQCLL